MIAETVLANDPPVPRGRLQRAVASFSDFLRHMRRRWYLYVPVFAIWGLAYARLFVDPTPRVPVVFNWTPSLPYRVALVHAVPADRKSVV